MIIANLLGATKIAIMTAGEVALWEASGPLDQDLILNSDTKTFQYFDGSTGSVIDLGGPVTTWKIDQTAPASGSYVTYPETIGRIILLFALNGQMFRVVTGTAIAANEVYHNAATGTFELYIGVTPAIQFNSEWLSIIYNNDVPAV